MSEIPQSQPPQYTGYIPPQPRKTRWWIPVVIIFGVLAVFVIGIIAFFAAVVGSINSSSNKVVEVKPNSVLMLNLSRPMSEYNAHSGLFQKQSPATFLEILNAVKRAKTDDNIKGIYIKPGTASGFAKATELLGVLEDFKQSGKFIYAFMESGERANYYAALSADSIFMPREGYLQLNAAGTSVMFYKGLFEKLGVDAHVEQFEEYKSFGEPYSRKSFSAPAKDELRTLIAQRADIFNQAVSKLRKMDLDIVTSAINRGIYTSDSLKANGFIDGFSTETEVREKLRVRSYGSDDKANKLRLVSIDNYSESSDKKQVTIADVKNQIAIIYASGTIRTGKRGGNSPFGGGGDADIASESFISDLKKARENEFVKAIILRIDSPGGSALASDIMWEEIQKTRKIKPVYASMSDVAASGGYYMAMACDTIIAHPQTITGSVGVIGILPTFAGTLDKIGITVDTISTGHSSHFMSPYLAHNEQDLKLFHTLMEGTYRRFVSKAAESRHKSYEDMRALAKGKVWSGNDAQKVGLVDVLGGWQTTLSLVKRRLGIADSTKVMVQIYPKPQDDIKELLKAIGINMDDDESDESSSDDNSEERLQAILRQTMGAAAWSAFTHPTAMPESIRKQFANGYSLLNVSMKEHTLMALPYSLE
ncbi:MAG: signal peptide peptidase SppA [Bacteroidetes bacterium]|nr:signal peptide peptidase SppA [Bacteroidota bacterium]